MHRFRSLFLAAVFVLPAPGAAASVPAPAAKTLSEQMPGLQFRSLGPFRGGRVTAVTGVAGQPLTFYFGATGGGVWKTVSAGQGWEPVSDKSFRTGSVGAIAVAESDPNVVYAGMGEACIRGNTSRGDGVWKSTDAGKSWTNVGLEATQQISAVVVHPKDPDTVWVAALGHTWGPNPDRGVFKSGDGGKTWRKVLFVDERTGASDLAIDPSNPRVLYAGFWQAVRKPWSFESGGPGSGLWKSTDGGESWKKLAGGLPEETVGKIGVAVSPARPDRVFAIVEAEKGGLFRTEDAGQKWTRVNDENKLRQRAWYYSHVVADPKSADTVYVLNVRLLKSVDGGKTFTPVRTPHGDNHDLWIDSNDPERMIEGNDGGAAVTLNGGRTWSSVLNQPTAQFYRIVTDNRVPYRVYGSQQDSTTVSIPSRTRGFGIGITDWHEVGGCESGWIAPDPKNRDVVYAGCYGGSITRYDERTGERREIVAWPQLAVGQAAKDLKYRFQWNAPILISLHDPVVLYHAAQKLLKSTDEGRTWVEISPDLTRNDPAKQQKSGGPITKDDTGVEVYDTIFAVAESPHEAGVIWVGTDDGLVHLTRDGGKNWTNVTPKGLPEWIQINAIDVSPHDKETAYVAATMYKHDDVRPYLYRTNDYGKSWTKIVSGIPDGAFTRAVREDPVRRGLLYAGTETGFYVSFDDGANWQPLQLNLPAVPVTDLAVKGNDVVVATQGRSFWILDDVTPLRAWKPAIAAEDVHLFAPAPAIRMEGGGPWWMEDEAPRGVGKNPANGAWVWYWLKEAPAEKAKGKDALTIEILDGETVLRTFTSEKPEEGEGAPPPEERREKPLEPKAGLNRFVWDLRMLRPQLVPKAIVWGNTLGPKVAPWTYRVRLKKGDTVLTETLEVRPHPEIAVSPADLKMQAELLASIRDRITDAHQAVVQIRDVKAQTRDVASRAEKLGKKEPVGAKAKALSEKLTGIEEQLVNPKLKSEQDVLNFPPALDHQFVGLATAVSSADGAPRPVEVEYFAALNAKLDVLLAELNAVLGTDLAGFNAAVHNEGIPPRVGESKGNEMIWNRRQAIGCLLLTFGSLFIAFSASAIVNSYEEAAWPAVVRLERRGEAIVATLGREFSEATPSGRRSGTVSSMSPYPSIELIRGLDGRWRREGVKDLNAIIGPLKHEPRIAERLNQVQRFVKELNRAVLAFLGEEAPTGESFGGETRVGRQTPEQDGYLWFGLTFYNGEGTWGLGGLGRLGQTGVPEFRWPKELLKYSVPGVAWDGRYLWAVTAIEGEYGAYPAAGLVRYEWASDRLERISGHDEAPCGFLPNSVLLDGQELWVSSEMGLSILDLQTKKWRHLVPDLTIPALLRPVSCLSLYREFLHSDEAHLPRDERTDRSIFLREELEKFRPEVLKEVDSR